MKIKILITTTLILCSHISEAQNKADDTIGNWLNAGKELAKSQTERMYKVL